MRQWKINNVHISGNIFEELKVGVFILIKYEFIFLKFTEKYDYLSNLFYI